MGIPPANTVSGIFGDHKARVLQLTRHKKICHCCGLPSASSYDCRIQRVRDLSCGDTRVYLDLEVRRVQRRRCKTVKQKRFVFLANTLFYTKSFTFYVGKRCSVSTISDVAKELHVDWKKAKGLKK